MLMVEVTSILLAVSFIIFFGFFAEFLFKKYHVPDVLLLIILGFIFGPHVLKYVTPEQFELFAPLFTTFALLFLLFDGAFNINLAAFARGLSYSFMLALFNFFISVIVVSVIMLAFGFGILVSLMTGFMLGGISSVFVIPLLKYMKAEENLYSVLTLESALSDVFTIVFALATIELITINVINFQTILSTIFSLFAVAGLIGIIGGILWILIVKKILKESFYMLTIAFVVLVYVITEFLHGNGAIAALFFGLVLRNSKLLTSIFKGIISRSEEDKKTAMKGELGVSVTTEEERLFYDQISFVLKTFFFVYIGVLINLSDIRILLLGLIIAVSILIARNASQLLTKRFVSFFDRELINSIFGRGLAAAAIAQIVILAGIPEAELISRIVYLVITFTIILSSVRIFIIKRNYHVT